MGTPPKNGSDVPGSGAPVSAAPIHGVTAQGAFSGSLLPRERLRGRVPRHLIGLIKERSGRGRLVVEIGARTGALTGALGRAGCEVVALEEDPWSVVHLRRSLGSVPVIRASPGAVPLRSASVSVVVIDHSLLGDDIGRRGRELRRIAAPEADVILVRSLPGDDQPDDAVPLVVPDWLIPDVPERIHGGSPGEKSMAVSVWSLVDRHRR